MGLAVGMMIGMNLAAYLQELMGLTDVWLVIGAMQLVTAILMMSCSISVERAIARNIAALAKTPEEDFGNDAKAETLSIDDDVLGELYSPRASDVVGSGFGITSFHTPRSDSRRASDLELRQRLSDRP